MRIKSEDILKPGAKMVVTEIDFNDPEVKRQFEETRKRQEQLAKNRGWRVDKHGWRKI